MVPVGAPAADRATNCQSCNYLKRPATKTSDWRLHVRGSSPMELPVRAPRGATYHGGAISGIGFQSDLIIECMGARQAIADSSRAGRVVCLTGVRTEGPRYFGGPPLGWVSGANRFTLELETRREVLNGSRHPHTSPLSARGLHRHADSGRSDR